MKISIQNLGPLQRADFSLDDLTIICGDNNTGKTYATYALAGFLSFWRDAFLIDIPQGTLSRLLDQGSVRVDLDSFARKADDILKGACEAFLQNLPRVFAASPERFGDTTFDVSVDPQSIVLLEKYEQTVRTAKTDLFSLAKESGRRELVATLLMGGKQSSMPGEVLRQMIGDSIKEIVFDGVFPRPFVASAERTGAAIFRKELNFTRNRLLEEIGPDENKKLDPFRLLTKFHQDYPLPVKANVEFVRELESLAKKESFLATDHPETLEDFADILGGQYMVTRSDELYFVPKGKRAKLPMSESSSATRSLLDLGFYLRHVARPNDLLIVDEPELNLHPKNQRRMARLFARLIKLGLRIFVTTHSDHIVRELNTLIMLGRDEPRIRDLARREHYKEAELLKASQIKVYIAEKALTDTGDGGRRKRRQTLTPADVDPDLGVAVSTFDDTIDEMNRIQDEIVWGGEG